MSSFYSGDIVAFEQDHAIVAAVCLTWSDIDPPGDFRDKGIYVPAAAPANLLKTWSSDGRPSPGYVMVEFLLPIDGCCLVAENMLRLHDRNLMVDDIVKRRPTDVQSGRVLSLSTECTLLPTCSIEAYASTRPFLVHKHQSSRKQPTSIEHTKAAEIHGFPNFDGSQPLLPVDESKLLKVAATDLSALQDFQENDCVFYEDWIGRISSILDDVTVRLTSGDVVIVKEPLQLAEPRYIPGTSSYELVRRLDRAGYRLVIRALSDSRKHDLHYPEFFYPGQHVVLQGSLRDAHWVSGAYEPSTRPEGIVIQVRAIEAEVEWLTPNFLDNDQEPGPSPPTVLGADIIHSGALKSLENGHMLLQPLTKALEAASDGDKMQFGVQVKFRVPEDAAVRYGHLYRTIPGSETRGYDINAMHITSTHTTVLVQWQDGTTSAESSIILMPTQAIDAQNVWPGDKVSLRADETTVERKSTRNPGSHEQIHDWSSRRILLAKTIGVVQTVDAVERLAKVRWFQNANFELDLDENNEPYGPSPSSAYGCMGEEITEVSLYDISRYEAFHPKLGDRVIARPAVLTTDPQLSDYFGRVSELCLDGEVIVRCSGASPPQDRKSVISALTLVASRDFFEAEDEVYGNPDEYLEESNESSVDTDGFDVGESDDNTEPIDVQIEYEGGENMDVDGNEDAWSTDDDDDNLSSTSEVSDISSISHKSSDTSQEKRVSSIPSDIPAHTHPESHLHESSTRQRAQASKPLAFMVLDDEPPVDHIYIGDVDTAAPNVGQKAAKENKAMRSSLPDGVFVRTWESRLDLLRALIVGPVGTPFEHAPYLFDLQLGLSFPDSPPEVYFHSWTDNLGRINPNLYEDGKVCLSLLGTWPADQKNEGWSKKSTVLQILVSILGLVLVKEPYYSEFREILCHQEPMTSQGYMKCLEYRVKHKHVRNKGLIHQILDEAGFEVFVGSEDSLVASRMYSEKAFVMAKGFIKRALSSPPAGMTDVVHWLYLAHPGPRLLDRVLRECQIVIQPSLNTLQREDESRFADHSRSDSDDSWIGSIQKLSSGAIVPLRRHLEGLVKFENDEEMRGAAAPADNDACGAEYTPDQSFFDLEIVPPAQALASHIVCKLGIIPEKPVPKDNINETSIPSNRTKWLVRPGLLWYHAPWLAIDLVSKNAYNVDWEMKPPFESHYDDNGRLKEDVFSRGWSNSLMTRPERKAKRTKRRSRAARVRAESAAQVLRVEELQTRLIWNLREIRPKQPQCEGLSGQGTVGGALDESSAVRAMSGYSDILAPSHGELTKRCTLASMNSLQHPDSNRQGTLRNQISVARPSHGKRLLENVEGQDYGVPTWMPPSATSFGNMLAQMDTSHDAHVINSSSMAGAADISLTGQGLSIQNNADALIPDEPTSTASGPATQAYFWYWNAHALN